MLPYEVINDKIIVGLSLTALQCARFHNSLLDLVERPCRF